MSHSVIDVTHHAEWKKTFLCFFLSTEGQLRADTWHTRESMLKGAHMLSLIATVAAQCADQGPWPCDEAGCPEPTISCERLRKNCDSMFDEVWTTPPAGLGGQIVSTFCPATCGKCNPPSVPPSESPEADGQQPDDSWCISWRQTQGCSANGKREARADRPCSATVAKGWSGYCECDGGVRTAESGCSHEEFTCAAKCVEQRKWLREQRKQKQQQQQQHADAEPFSADDNLNKLYKVCSLARRALPVSRG